MGIAQLNLSLDSDFKKDVDAVFESIGLTTTEAVRMFLRQAQMTRRLPLVIDSCALRVEQLPVLSISEEGKETLAKLLQQPAQAEKLEKLMAEYEQLKKKLNVEVIHED